MKRRWSPKTLLDVYCLSFLSPSFWGSGQSIDILLIYIPLADEKAATSNSHQDKGFSGWEIYVATFSSAKGIGAGLLPLSRWWKSILYLSMIFLWFEDTCVSQHCSVLPRGVCYWLVKDFFFYQYFKLFFRYQIPARIMSFRTISGCRYALHLDIIHLFLCAYTIVVSLDLQ